MKKYIILFCLLFGGFVLNAQLKKTVACPDINVNLLDGKVNGALPSYTVAQIKGLLPCFTSAEEESATAKCGGGVFYKDKDIYFYTARNYVEIGPKFKGKLSLPLMGASRNNLFKWLGNAKVKDVKWDAFGTAYGIMILYYDKANKVNKIQFSTESTETIQLCE